MIDTTKRLDRFSNEVLRKGPEAVLPQNLSDQWLAALAAEADGILAPSGTEQRPEPACLTVVACNLLALYGKLPHLVPEDELVECVQTYAIHIALERLFRSTGIKREDPKPTVANILDKNADLIAILPPHIVSRAKTTLN
jgi:hypothetical protein